MKFLHEMLLIFHTEFSKFPRTAYLQLRRASISVIFGFKNTAWVIVPVFIEFVVYRALTQAQTDNIHSAIYMNLFPAFYINLTSIKSWGKWEFNHSVASPNDVL
jgi:hypothetical protein